MIGLDGEGDPPPPPPEKNETVAIHVSLHAIVAVCSFILSQRA